MRFSVSRISGPAMVITPVTGKPGRRTGAAIAVMPGEYISLMMLNPRLRSSCRIRVRALMVVGALGPNCLGSPKPCLDTISTACSSLNVISQAWPAALQDSFTSMPMSGS